MRKAARHDISGVGGRKRAAPNILLRMTAGIAGLLAMTVSAPATTDWPRTQGLTAAPVGLARAHGSRSDPGVRASIPIGQPFPGDRVSLSASSGWAIGRDTREPSVTKRKAGPVTQDKYEILGPLLSELGQELAALLGGNPDGVFLYVEAGEGWVAPSVFRADGDVVRYHPSEDSAVSEILSDIWYAEPDKTKRWSVMEYVVQNGKFRAEYKFPDEVDVTKPDNARREAALRAHFGRRTVIYPPIEGMTERKPSPTT
jgi:hypothetical protein